MAGLKAFAIALILTPILRDIFRSYNIVDRPGFRRIHRHPVPRIGGIPIAIAYAFAIFSLSGANSGLGVVAFKLLPGAGIVFLTGLIDDFFNLPALAKLGGQIIAALLVFSSGLSIETLGASNTLPLWLNLPLTIFWLLLTTNALNLIDGLDGLCAGIGFLATLTLFGAAMLYGNQPLAYATLPLAAALLGFLYYNSNPATVFLGDSGALLIGFLLGCYGMIWTQKTSTLLGLLVPLIALSVPLLDVLVAIARRLLRRQPIFGADRAHIHHRLLDRGLTPKRAVWVLYLFAACAAGLALLLSAPQVARFRNILLVLLAVAIWLGLRELRYKEFDVIGQIFFGNTMRKHLQEQLTLDQMISSLNAATTREEWWIALTKTAAGCGWSKLCWVSSQATQEINNSSLEPAWTFQIPLGDLGFIQVEGPKRISGLDLVEFAYAVQQSAASRDWHPIEVH